jgi:hypothetical protein
MTDQVMFELRELSGQEYVNTYAKRKDVVGGAEPAKLHAVVDATNPGAEPAMAATG